MFGYCFIRQVIILKSLFAFDDLPKIAKKSFFLPKKGVINPPFPKDLYNPNDKKLCNFLYIIN